MNELVNEKKNYLLLTIGILFIGLMTIVGSYAFWTWNSSTDKTVVFNTSKALEEYIIYDSGESKFVGDFQVADSYTQGMHSTISVKKTEDAKDHSLYATIYMDINEIGEYMKVSPALKWAITSGDSDDNGKLLNQGVFYGQSAGDTIELKPSFEVTTTEQKFTVWIWLDSSESIDSNLTGETLDVNVFTQIDQIALERFEITKKTVRYQLINATAINSTNDITHYAVITGTGTPSEWVSIPSDEVDRVYNLEYTASSTGKYYIWFKDSKGNTVSDSVEVTQIDTTAPVCTWGEFDPDTIQNGETSTVTLTCVDNESGLSGNKLASSDITVTNTSVVTLSSNVTSEKVTGGYKYTFTLTGKAVDGTTKLTLPAGIVSNGIDLKNAETTSDDLTVASEVIATLKYYNDASTTLSCLVTSAGGSCSITLPTTASASPDDYTFLGWSTSSTCNAQTTYVSGSVSISSDTTYYACYSTDVTVTFYYSDLTENDLYYTDPHVSTTKSGKRYMGYSGTIADTQVSIPDVVANSTGGGTAPNYEGVAKSINSATVLEDTAITTANTSYYAVYTEPLTFYYYDGTNHTSKLMKRRFLSDGTNYVTSLSGTAPTPSAYNGFSYKNWSYTTDSINYRSPTQTGVTELYAYYQKTVSITYNVNGCGTTPSNQSITKTYISTNGGINLLNSSMTIAAQPSGCVGNKFTGWNTSADGSGTSYTAGSTYTGNDSLILYAQWTTPSYTLTYDYVGGAVSTANPSTYTSSTETFTLNNPTKTGYTFTGYTEKISTNTWYSGFITLDTGAIESYNSSYPDSVYSELIYLEAGVKYTISGTDLGGVRWRFYNTSLVYQEYGQEYSYTPSVNGYVRILLYEGCTEANRNAAVITSSQGTSVSIVKGSTGNRKYIANWSADTYTITYNTNGGTLLPSGYTPIEYIQSSGTQYIDTGFTPNQDTSIEMVTMPLEISNLTDGSGFAPYGAGEAYNSRAYEMYSWDGTYQSNHGTSPYHLGTAVANQITTINKKKTVLTVQNESNTYNYTHTANTFTAPYTMYLFALHRASIIPSGAMRLYSAKIYDNGVLVRNFIPCKDSSGTIGLYDSVNGKFYTNSGTGTFTAGRVVNSYTIETDTFLLPIPSKENYEFAGWYESSDLSGTALTEISKGSSGNKTLYAKWEAISYTITANANGGTIPATTGWTVASDSKTATKGVPYGETYGTLPTPTKTGYTFNGWYTATSGGAQVTSTTTMSVSSNHTLYAQYTPITYTITYNANGGTLLPSGYTPLEYIQSTGTQYINTGYNASSNTNIIYDYEYVSGNSGSWIPILGQRVTSGSNMFTLWVNSSNKAVAVNYGSVDTSTISGTDGTGRHTYSNIDNKFYLDGTLISEISTSAFQSSYPLYIFALNSTDQAAENRNSNGKLYSLRIYDNEILVRNFIPAKNSSGTIGLYDSVNGKFYTNSGTGSFTAGPAVNSYTIETSTFTLPIPSKEGYEFAGWYESSNLSGTALTEISKGSSGNKTLYAKWTGDSYILTANSQGGTIPATTGWTVASGSATATKSITYGSTYGTLPTPTRDGYTFKGWSLVPNEYQQVEYIEATGTQYIKTGVTNKARWEFDIQFTNTTTRQLMGYGGSGSEYWGVQTDGNYGIGLSWSNTGYAAGNRDKVIHNYGENGLYYLDVNGTRIGVGVTDVTSKEYQIFAIGGGYLNNAKLYRARTIQNGNLIRDFIPCYRKRDGAVGLYDTVNGVFYTNAGSGTFSYGSTSYITSSTTVSTLGTHTIYANWQDTAGPTITSVSASTTYDIRNYVTFTANDSGSGIIGYNITTSTTAPTTWIPVISAVESTTETKYAYSASWARVFHHNTHWGSVLYSNATEAKSSNTSDKYSVLGNLANYVNSSSTYEFLLEYPGVSGYNRWKQTSNPATTSESVTGYSAVNVSWTSNYWAGLALSNSGATFIDGSINHGNWYYAIGSYSAWGGAIPGATEKVSHINLWARIDDKTATATTSSITRRIGDISSNGTYYVWVKDSLGNTSYKSVTVSKVDTTAPTAKITASNATTVNLSYSDSGGVTKYYFGTSNPSTTNVSWTSISSTTSGSTTKTVSSAGTYYFATQDAAGNITVTSTAVYTVSYNANGGSGAPSSQIKVSGSTLTLTTNAPTYTGYIFSGWNTASDGSGTSYASGASFTSNANTTLYAKWTKDTAAPTYSSYEIKNITSSGYDVYIYGVSDPSGVDRVQFPTWTSYNGQDDIQSSWTTNSSATGTKQSDGTTWVYRVNTTDHNGEAGTYTTHIYLYDSLGNSRGIGLSSVTVPGITVTLKPNNSSYGTVSASTVSVGYGATYTASGSTISFPAGQSVTASVTNATGYTTTFSGWSATSGTVTQAITITANFTRTANNYYLDLNGLLDGSSNGGISGYGTADVYINGSLVADDVSDYYTAWPYGTSYEIKDIKATTGHTYNGVSSGSLSGTVGAATTVVQLKFTTNTYTVYYTDSVDLTTGRGNVSSTTADRMTYSITDNVVTVKANNSDGYGFIPYRVALTAGTSYVFNATCTGTWGSSGECEAFIMLDGGYSHYYHMSGNNGYVFTPTTTGTYWLRLDVNTNGNTQKFSNISFTKVTSTATVTYGSTYGTLPTVTRTGYDFSGWYTAIGSGTQVTSTTTVSTASNHVIYARWGGTYYTNSYPNILYGTADQYFEYTYATKTESVAYGTTITLDSSKVVSVPNGTALHHFGSSYGSSSWNGYDIGATITQPSYAIAVNTYLTAIDYSVTYNLNGGTNSSSNPSTYNVLKGFTLSNPTRTGYTFTGWTNASGTTITGINASTLSSSFSSADDMNTKLNARTTGNQVLTANWQDTTAPSISVSNTVNGSTYSGAWTNGTITSVITFSDSGSGINASSLAWGTDGTNWTSLSNSSTSTFTDTWAAEGSRKGYYRICDNAGNCNSVSFDVKIDKSGPTGTVSLSYNDGFIATVSSLSDSLSGSPSVVGYLITTSSSCPTSGYTSSTATSYSWTSYSSGTYYACVKVKDSLGNVSYLISNASTPVAYAIYSADDNSLRFYKTSSTITAGSTYNGLTATEIYTGFEATTYSAQADVPWYNYRENITKVIAEDKISPVSTGNWFARFANFANMDLSNLDTSKTTNMTAMFAYAGFNSESITIIGLNNFNTSNVTDMSNLFFNFGYLNATTISVGDLSNWNTANVTDMSRMFNNFGTSKLETFNVGDLSGWNTTNVTDMSTMFKHAGYSATAWSVGNLSSWNTTNVTDMSGMFYNAGYTATGWSLNLSGWNVSKVTSYDNFNSGVTSKITSPNFG